MPLVACFFDFGPGRLWPIESSLTAAISGYSRLLTTVGNIEVQRMSWIPQALAFDQAEQCQLELKAGVECAADRIENAKAAAAAAAATGMSAAAAVQRLVVSKLFTTNVAFSPAVISGRSSPSSPVLKPIAQQLDSAQQLVESFVSTTGKGNSA
jgi:hypothetical protein